MLFPNKNEARCFCMVRRRPGKADWVTTHSDFIFPWNRSLM